MAADTEHTVAEASARQPVEKPAAPREPRSPEPTPSRPPRRRSFVRPLLALVVVAGAGWFAWRVYHRTPPASRHAGSQTQRVSAAPVTSGDVDEVYSGIGTVTPLATITVQTQISGQLESVGFKEGQIVHKGDFLAQIDPRPYQAALDQAEGQLAHDQGLLAQAESDLKRYQTLGRQDSIAIQQVADQQFLVQQDRGTVAVDQANIETAKLNLSYCHIVAPINGRVGLRLVDPGNYVQTASATGLVVLTQLQPISIIFVLPEDQIPQVWDAVKAGRTLTVEAWDRANAHRIATGKLESIDNEIDTTTGVVKLRATFENADESLYPNQFVNAHLLVKTERGATLAPSAAVQHGAPGAYVYKLKPGDIVEMVPVKTGLTEGQSVQILSGLSPGDQVVVDGVDRLRDGMKVETAPESAGKPSASPPPSPAPSTPK